MANEAGDTANPVIFFDGYCNLCNGAVQWIIKRDTKEQFYFTPISSQYAGHVLSPYFLTSVDSIVLVADGQTYIKSTAALEIAGRLPYPYPLLKIFSVIPAVLRDLVYDFIARNRYRIWGKRDACMIPTPDLKARFLE